MGQLRKRRGMPSAILLLVAWVTVSCSRSGRGTFPYDAAMTDVHGAPAKLAPLRGLPVVVVAYVASMPDCRERIRQFVSLSRSLRNPALRFVAIDIGFGAEDKFPDVLPEDRGNVLFLHDRSQEFRKALRIDITPTTFFVSSGGQIRDRMEGSHRWDSPDFRRRVDKFAGNA